MQRHLLSKNDLGKRYGCTVRNVDRHRKRKIIPEPDVEINGRPFWYEDRIEDNERTRLVPKEKSVA